MDVKKIVLVLLVLLAGGGAFFLSISGQNNGDEAPVTIVKSGKEETLSVLVASGNINRGDRLTTDNLSWQDWPKKTVRKNESFLTGGKNKTLEELDGAVAKTTFVAGEPIIEEKIVRAGSAGLMAAIMTPGKRALGLRVNAETSSGGFILPGDHVDVIYTAEDRETRKRVIRTILEDVRVLAVNDVFSENSESPVIEGVNITLELTPVESEQFILARASGELSLALRSIHDENVVEKQTELESEKPRATPKQKSVKIIRIGRS